MRALLELEAPPEKSSSLACRVMCFASCSCLCSSGQHGNGHHHYKQHPRSIIEILVRIVGLSLQI